MELGDLDLADLCDPGTLASLGTRPDVVAARDRETTQELAGRIAGTGADGLRWWSRFMGEWHTVVVFSDRVGGDPLAWGEPRILEPGDPDLLAALDAIGMRVA